MAGTFEVYQDKADKWRFRLKAGNGEIIAVGEAYESKSGAMNGVDSVKRNAGDASVQEVAGTKKQ
ncbi:YegP family protein [Streptomyces fildesensis]|uniref:YegP family protein n=1 Tax=Streptomyces fildesensis TaxID=375757 RepID=A0ABW8C6T0_9ACTN